MKSYKLTMAMVVSPSTDATVRGATGGTLATGEQRAARREKARKTKRWRWRSWKWKTLRTCATYFRAKGGAVSFCVKGAPARVN